MCDDSSHSVQKEHTVKTLIIGRKGVGKTTLFNTYKSDIIRIFRSCFVYRPKDDASKVLCVMYGDIVKINIWDLPHVIPRDEAIPSKHVAGCGVIILMYDVTK
jgi:GTPase SAR1 family protein